MSYCVYYHENKINRKRYVGITCRRPVARWGLRGQRYIECPHFWNAICKYGWDNFEHVILCSGLTKKEAEDLEVNLIEIWNLRDPEYGYNISAGGSGGDSETMKELWKNNDLREKWSNSMKEAWKDPEKRQRRSESAKQRWADPEFHEKACKAVNAACAKPIICIETNARYSSAKEAGKTLGIWACNSKRAIEHGYLWGGYHWKYADDVS